MERLEGEGGGKGRRDGTAERNIVIWIHFGAILNPSWPPNLPVPPIFYPPPPFSGLPLRCHSHHGKRNTCVPGGAREAFNTSPRMVSIMYILYNLTSRLVVSRFQIWKLACLGCVLLHLQFDRKTRWCNNGNGLLWQPRLSRHPPVQWTLMEKRRDIYIREVNPYGRRERKRIEAGCREQNWFKLWSRRFQNCPRRSAGSEVPMSDRRNPCVCFIKEAPHAKDRWTDGVTEKREGVTVEILSEQRALLPTVCRSTSLLAFSPFPCRLRTCIYY